MRKGQGISLTVIIVAAIALIVLVVLVAIFSGRMGGWIRGVQSCPNKDGVCVTVASGNTPGAQCKLQTDGRAVSLPNTDCGEGKTCCIAP